MTKIDRPFMRTIFTFFAVLGFLTIIAPTQSMAADPAFTITDVNVDVTSDNAAKAREEAFAQAQYSAFRQLADRLLSKEEIAGFQMPDVSTISTLINDFEVTNEKLSPVRYVGTYTFSFKDKEVRKYLNMQNMSFTDVASKPVLVLPFYDAGGKTVLWDDSNLWMKAWAQNKTFQGLVPVMIPIGDLQDVADIDGSQPLTYDNDKMQNMIDRYNTREALIVIAAPKNPVDQGGTMVPSKLDISMYQTSGDKPRFLRSIEIENKNDTDFGQSMFNEGVQRVRSVFQDQWKSQTVVDSAYNSVGSQIKARVRFTNVEEWVETQNALKNVAGVTETKLLSLTPRSAELQILFKGTENRLRLALSQANLTLSNARPEYSNQQFQNNGYMGAAQVYDLYLNKFKPRP